MRRLFVILFFPLLAAAQIPLDGASHTNWAPAVREAQALFREGRYADAVAPAKQAIETAKESSPNSDRLGGSYYLLGMIYREWGQCSEARGAFSHALAIFRKQPTPRPAFVFNSVLSLINTAGECEEYDVAGKAYRTYRAELEKYQSSPLDESRLLSARATLARGRNKFAEAEALMRQAIDVLENAPPNRIPANRGLEVALLHSNLAVVLGRQHRYQDAYNESLMTIGYFEKEGSRHPSRVAALHNAACSLADLGRKAEAASMFQRALDAAIDLYGQEHRLTGRIMLSYASLLRESQQPVEAAAMEKQGSELFKRSLLREKSIVDVENLKH